MKNYFMAGLPRSGSTLLSAILNQNPDIHSGPSSPVLPLMLHIEEYYNQCELFNANPNDDIAKNVISSILPQHYSDRKEKVIIDKNRSWSEHTMRIKHYFDIEPKIICPVRDMEEVVASFLFMCEDQKSNINFIDKSLIKMDRKIDNYNRMKFLLEEGVVGQSYNSLAHMVEYCSPEVYLFVEYKDLCEDPQETMNQIYEFLDLPAFKHNFESIESPFAENDLEVYGLENMHKVRKTITPSTIDSKIFVPREISDMLRSKNFWTNK